MIISFVVAVHGNETSHIATRRWLWEEYKKTRKMLNPTTQQGEESECWTRFRLLILSHSTQIPYTCVCGAKYWKTNRNERSKHSKNILNEYCITPIPSFTHLGHENHRNLNIIAITCCSFVAGSFDSYFNLCSDCSFFHVSLAVYPVFIAFKCWRALTKGL